MRIGDTEDHNNGRKKAVRGGEGKRKKKGTVPGRCPETFKCH